MDSLQNNELNPTRHFLESPVTANYYEQMTPFIGQSIDVNNDNISYAINFESEPVNEWSYYFDQEYTSADI